LSIFETQITLFSFDSYKINIKKRKIVSTKGNIVKFTPSAISQINKLIEKDEANRGKQLRLGAKNGGCAGFSYIFEFDDKKESDIIENIEGFSMIVDNVQASMILGLEVDFEGGLNNRGFIFTNPNAKTTCGCGTSFS